MFVLCVNNTHVGGGIKWMPCLANAHAWINAEWHQCPSTYQLLLHHPRAQSQQDSPFFLGCPWIFFNFFLKSKKMTDHFATTNVPLFFGTGKMADPCIMNDNNDNHHHQCRHAVCLSIQAGCSHGKVGLDNHI